MPFITTFTRHLRFGGAVLFHASRISSEFAMIVLTDLSALDRGPLFGNSRTIPWRSTTLGIPATPAAHTPQLSECHDVISRTSGFSRESHAAKVSPLAMSIDPRGRNTLVRIPRFLIPSATGPRLHDTKTSCPRDASPAATLPSHFSFPPHTLLVF